MIKYLILKLLLYENSVLNLLIMREGFQSIPIQMGKPPIHSLPDDHDKLFYDGSAHPESLMDTHWTCHKRGRPWSFFITGQLFFFAFIYTTSYLSAYFLPGGFHLNGEF